MKIEMSVRCTEAPLSGYITPLVFIPVRLCVIRTGEMQAHILLRDTERDTQFLRLKHRDDVG